MKPKIFIKNIYGKKINVDAIPMEKNEIIYIEVSDDNKQEISNLLREKYIEVMDKLERSEQDKIVEKMDNYWKSKKLNQSVE
jgi:hypothetical protein